MKAKEWIVRSALALVALGALTGFGYLLYTVQLEENRGVPLSGEQWRYLLGIVAGIGGILLLLLVIAGLIGRATQGRELPAGKAAKGEGWSFYGYDSYAPGRVERQNRRRPHFEKRPEKKEGSK